MPKMSELRYFAILDEDNLVVNASTFPLDADPSVLIENYSSRYKLQEYSIDNSITNNQGYVGLTYDQSLNAFIPKKPDPTYILNTEEYIWEPDPSIKYNLNNDDNLYTYDPITKTWTLYVEPPPSPEPTIET